MQSHLLRKRIISINVFLSKFKSPNLFVGGGWACSRDYLADSLGYFRVSYSVGLYRLLCQLISALYFMIWGGLLPICGKIGASDSVERHKKFYVDGVCLEEFWQTVQ